MRLVVPLLIALAVTMGIVLLTTPQAHAQRAPGPGGAVVVPALPGEAMRITTPRRAPSSRESLRQYRGVRVYRAAPAQRLAVPARATEPAFPITTAQRRSFVRQGGSFFLVGPQADG